MNNKINHSPRGWSFTTLGNITDIKYGKNLPTKQLKASGYPVFGANGIIGYFDRYLYEKEQILISCRGAYSGKINICPPKCFITNNSLVLEFYPCLSESKKYFFYILQAADKSKLVTGTAQPQVTINNAVDLFLPLPPLPEQHRIVAKIEELFTKLDAGVEALKLIQTQLKRYRQSVLKAAVEGRLSAEWREQHKDELEPADKLIERIQEERKAKLDKKYKELEQVDTLDLPKLPEGWDWASFSLIGELNRGKSKHRPRNDPTLYNGAYPFVQTGDIRDANKFVRTYSQTYNEIGLKQSRLWPKETLCITIAANIADTAILDFDACFPDSIVGFTPNQSCNIFFIEYFLRTAKENLNRYAPATAQKNINLKILSELLIPLPPKIEQDKIVDELDRIFSLADQLDSIIELELKRAQNLRQSILKYAFEGKLVPQDPDDEPASVLLERIKAEKAKPKRLKQLEMF